jgi:hypothetical protein
MPETRKKIILTTIFTAITTLIIEVFVIVSCNTDDKSDIMSVRREPAIEPDYSGVTVPRNIAPLNFCILEEGASFIIRCISSDGKQLFVLKSPDGVIRFPIKSWRKVLSDNQGKTVTFEVYLKAGNGELTKYSPFSINISNESVDPYLCYRLLYPGYESWSEMKIVQRSTEDFSESSVFENQLLEDNCVNCHTFLKYNPGRFFLHVRGSMKGTYFVDDKGVTRRILRTGNMIANAVYPAWHPEGRYVVFSSNEVVQSFHMIPGKKTEVYDQSSTLVIFDSDINTISAIEERDTTRYMETFPCWSPRGDYLYYCRTDQVKKNFDFRKVKYDLVRKAFDMSSQSFGDAEVVFNAREIDKSVSFPAISPDGRNLVFTLHDYGTFSIWHKEADLYLLDLLSGKVNRLNINSDESESYHSWSSNGKWLVFSSKRDDGLTARPYLAYFGSPDNIGKPFVLPQKDPAYYKRLVKTFNRPEFVTGKIVARTRDFARASRKEPLNAIWADPDR